MFLGSLWVAKRSSTPDSLLLMLLRARVAAARVGLTARTAQRQSSSAAAVLAAKDRFEPRHNGPRDSDVPEMLATIGVSSVEELVTKTVPSQILLQRALDLGKYSPGLSESDALTEMRRIASNNKVNRSFIGMGYHDCKTPAVILRNVLENPGWYTQYTPYQPEVAQGRLECLMTFQVSLLCCTPFQGCRCAFGPAHTICSHPSHPVRMAWSYAHKSSHGCRLIADDGHGPDGV